MKKLLSIATALTVVALVAGPGTASALTAEELQAQINSLLATLQSLQAQLVVLQGGSTGTTVCTITSFTRNLTVGSSGADVQCLQKVFNAAADTQVASAGVGSPGNETTYFGPLTKAAAVKFQEKYTSEILTPVGLSSGTGFVGPSTRAKLNTMLGGGGVVPTPPPPTGAGLTVALAVNTPVAGTIVDGQALAPMVRFTFTNGDSSEVKVTGLKLKRVGISADSSLTNVYLYR